MSIEVLWDDLNILTIEKKDDLFFSYIDSENLMKARKTGFPIFFLKQISIVSDNLPAIVRQRIPRVENKEIINNKEEKDICEYINSTGCKRPTDKFSIKIDIN
ncbi:MAG: hypothetical protein ACI4ON_01105 [Clostridia bacterium]